MSPILLVGDPKTFALESRISIAYERRSQVGLGYFVMHIGGSIYGIKNIDATMLACSLDQVSSRISDKGNHNSYLFWLQPDILCIATTKALYENISDDFELLPGINSASLRNHIIHRQLLFAPDGDAAFDDGSHILQFDQGNKVRLVAFRHGEQGFGIVNEVREVILEADNFYGVLSGWASRFEAQWKALLTGKT